MEAVYHGVLSYSEQVETASVPSPENRLLARVHHWLESSEGLRSQVFRDYLMALENESDVI